MAKYCIWNTLHLTHPSAHTQPMLWAANAAAPGEQLGVRCLAQGPHLSRGIDSFQSCDRLEDLEGKTSIELLHTSVSIFHLFPSREYLDHLSKE